MKHGKKLLALALALCMAFALAVPAFAADEITIGGVTLPNGLPEMGNPNSEANPPQHTYKLYQIFGGEFKDATDNEKAQLMAVTWGSDIDGQKLVEALAGKPATETEEAKESAFLTAYTALGAEGAITNPFENIKFDPNRPKDSADAVARALGKLSFTGDNDLKARAFAQVVNDCLKEGVNGIPATSNSDGTYTANLPAAGYYLTVDEMDGGTNNQVKSLYILAMEKEGEYKFTPKADVPKLDKQVLETNDSDSTDAKNGWNDTAADYDIGDQVPFVLTGTVSSRYNDFKTYKYEFQDTLSTGLTFDFTSDTAKESGNIKVFVSNTDTDGNTTSIDITNNDNCDIQVDGQNLTVSFADLKQIEDVTATSKIQVVYTARLNETAKVGGEGNSNEAKLIFSNDPNHTGEGEPTGETPKDKVTVFTFELNVNKVKEDSTAADGTSALEGAGFTLYKKYATAQTDKGDALEGSSDENGYYYKVLAIGPSGDKKPTTFTFKGLDAGEYMLSETTYPQGYNKIEDMYFTIKAVEGTDKSGNVVVTELKVTDLKDKNNNPMKAANGQDDAITFTPELTENNDYTGKISTDILNLKGVVLPGTGGIGTTIFYVVGGLLIAGAGVVLITKKRMKNAE